MSYLEKMEAGELTVSGASMLPKEMRRLYTLLTILGLFIALVDKLTDKFVTGEFKKVSETDGKLVSIWGHIIILGTSFILMFTVLDIFDDRTMMWFFAMFMATILGFQAWTEWRYLEGTKHVATFILMVVSVITFLGIADVLDQRKYTTFDEVVLLKLETDQIEKVDITRYSDSASLTLKDPDQVEKLLGDFKQIELREKIYYEMETYGIIIYGGHKTDSGSIFNLYLKEDGFMRILEINSDRSRNRSHEYAIVNDVNFLEFLESEELEWEVAN